MKSLRVLVGDALIAAGEAIQGGLPSIPEFDPNYQRHTAAGWTAPAPLQTYTTGESIAPDVVRSALDDLPDSKLLRIAATIITGWKPILLSSAAAALTDVDLFIQALRDRADQFEAVERDADSPFPLTPTDLDRHLNPADYGGN
ncbi:hypothetical protein AVT46_gp34 [Mycobacterium phage MOOREtheMARYer]|uniref:Uncharacterized protein n=1 Tax=Mycobacterium phage MOOREtheMARYer TaxID=1647309 RepID=A0A0F6YQW3_9CAUD|nr:hypothetical protein AVT46_gp34 [Mycobacterium phage MOOREtheMARYer]AKF14895.1 hypothetical protein SEA_MOORETHEMARYER_34 [Mycobacterium phage MOOREtheMARYer]